jgi:hypothetical protein
MMVSAVIATKLEAEAYQANIVEYQCASSDITHCQIQAAVVKPRMIRKGAAYFLIRAWWV